MSQANIPRCCPDPDQEHSFPKGDCLGPEAGGGWDTTISFPAHTGVCWDGNCSWACQSHSRREIQNSVTPTFLSCSGVTEAFRTLKIAPHDSPSVSRIPSSLGFALSSRNKERAGGRLNKLFPFRGEHLLSPAALGGKLSSGARAQSSARFCQQTAWPRAPS